MSRWTDAVSAILATRDLELAVSVPSLECPMCASEIRICPSRRRGGWFAVHLRPECPYAWQEFELCETAFEARCRAEQVLQHDRHD